MCSLSLPDKPVILQLSSTCVVDNLEVLCRCSVDSNPKAAVTWSVNGTVPPHDYNMSTTSQPDKLTATLWGRMDKPQTVICFAVNALGNDSLMLLQGAEGVFMNTALHRQHLSLFFFHCYCRLELLCSASPAWRE